MYLLIRQHVPLERAQEAMEALFAAPVSEGTLSNWTLDTAQRLAPFITELKTLLQAAPVVCADETPVRCGTGSSFVHTISTRQPHVVGLPAGQLRGQAAFGIR